MNAERKLTDEQIAEMADRYNTGRAQGDYDFARAIESAVRSHDAALLRQAREALAFVEKNIVLIGNACNDKHVTDAVMDRAMTAQVECIDTARAALAALDARQNGKAGVSRSYWERPSLQHEHPGSH